MPETPSAYQLGAALTVARLIDQIGNTRRDARDTYRQALTQGEYPAAQLEVGEQLLLRAGLLEQNADRVTPAAALHVLAATDDATAAHLLAARLQDVADGAGPTPTDEERRALVGATGENAVVEVCRTELRSLGRPALADGVQRVSLVSDALGFDVLAPTLVGPTRRLEVKTQTGHTGAAVRFFLTRNEFDAGRRHPDSWAVVACRLREGPATAVDVVGWCRVDSLRPYLPEDRQGRWTEALVHLPVAALAPGVPPAV